MSIKTNVTVRPATVDDWEVIADFNTRLAFETEQKTLLPATIEAGVKVLLSQPVHGRYFLACVEGNVVGQIMHTREWSDWRNGEIWWLQSVYVHPEYRGSGVFRELHGSLEKLARQTPGVIGLRLYVEQHNSKAQDAYRSLGLVDAGYTVMECFF